VPHEESVVARSTFVCEEEEKVQRAFGCESTLPRPSKRLLAAAFSCTLLLLVFTAGVAIAVEEVRAAEKERKG